MHIATKLTSIFPDDFIASRALTMGWQSCQRWLHEWDSSQRMVLRLNGLRWVDTTASGNSGPKEGTQRFTGATDEDASQLHITKLNDEDAPQLHITNIIPTFS